MTDTTENEQNPAPILTVSEEDAWTHVVATAMKAAPDEHAATRLAVVTKAPPYMLPPVKYLPTTFYGVAIYPSDFAKNFDEEPDFEKVYAQIRQRLKWNENDEDEDTPTER